MHYEDGDPLSWSSVALNLSMREHDVIGCGWEGLGPTEETSDATGRVYFTRNGKRLAEVLDGISTGLFPVVHIQKKVCARHTRLNYLQGCCQGQPLDEWTICVMDYRSH